MATEKYRITEGPSKYDLVIGLFENRGSYSRTVKFQLKLEQGSRRPHLPGMAEIGLNSLEREDGSGENWIFTGTVKALNHIVKGFFDCRSRKGHLEVTSVSRLRGMALGSLGPIKNRV